MFNMVVVAREQVAVRGLAVGLANSRTDAYHRAKEMRLGDVGVIPLFPSVWERPENGMDT